MGNKKFKEKETLDMAELKKKKIESKELNKFDVIPTPEKPCNYSTVSAIPPKYVLLVEFFNSMDCSIRLLRLKQKPPTFANICSSIQHLTGRRFTHRHLAQMKYILPESIIIKKVVLRDEATCCMKPELQVYLQADAIQSSIKRKVESGHSILRKLFKQRIEKFSRKHPEANDIPEEMLPHPFSRSIVTTNSTCSTPTNSMPTNSTVDNHNFVATTSHFSKSFKRCFSQRTLIPDEEKTSPACNYNGSDKNGFSITTLTTLIPGEENTSFAYYNADTDNNDSSITTLTTPTKFASSSNQNHSSGRGNNSPQNVGTPVKSVSTPIRLMAATPDIQTPKKHHSNVDDDSPVKEIKKRSARARLFRTPEDGAEPEVSKKLTISVPDDDDVDISILPADLLQKIREEERRTEKERIISIAKAKKRKEMIAYLPKLFDMIILIFQSGSRTTIPKQELINKIVAGYFSMVDRSDVEQQLILLQEFAPGWISSKMVSRGVFLYSLNESSSPEEIRHRLTEAK